MQACCFISFETKIIYRFVFPAMYIDFCKLLGTKSFIFHLIFKHVFFLQLLWNNLSIRSFNNKSHGAKYNLTYISRLCHTLQLISSDELLDEWKNSKVWETSKSFVNIARGYCAINSLPLVHKAMQLMQCK